MLALPVEIRRSLTGLVCLACALAGCQDGSDSPQRCNTVADCPAGETCDRGACYLTCFMDTDCPDGRCVSGICRIPCTLDAHCHSFETCSSGFCLPVESDPPDGGFDGGQDGGSDGGADKDPLKPTEDDRDGDGLPNDLEDANANGIQDAWETDPDNPDSDGDGLIDGIEDGNANGQRDEGETDPLQADTDGDGLPDGIEDRDKDGQHDPGETSALDPDSDDDGLNDGQEDADLDGVVDAGETDPTNADTDDDGLPDGIEDTDGDGQVGGNETDPLNQDSDSDGLADGLEDTNGNGHLDFGETDPSTADSDADGLADGLEDANQNGQVDGGETNPMDADSDHDGIPDGLEDADQDGQQDVDETNPLAADSDSDGLSDGAEDCNGNHIWDSGTETDPLDADTDNDGVDDGDEDRNGDCQLGSCTQTCDGPNQCPDGSTCVLQLGVCVSPDCSQGETSPHVADSDGDGLVDGQEGTQLVCSADNLKPIDLHSGFEPDFLLALEPFMTVYSDLYSGDLHVGAVFRTPDHDLAGFIISHPPATGATNANQQEASDRPLVGGLMDTSAEVTRTLISWDGHDAVIGEYDLNGGAQQPTELVNDLAQALFGGALIGLLQPAGASSGTYRLVFETIYRGADRVVTTGAVSADGLLAEAQLIRLSDIGNSTPVAQAADSVTTRCDTFASRTVQPVDFIWVVDNSQSMTEEQTAVAAAGTAMEAALANTSLDWRVGVTSTDSSSWTTGGDGQLVGGDFTRDINTFKARIQLGISGPGSEYGLRNGIRAIERASPCDPDEQQPSSSKLRCNATIVVVVLSDEDSQYIEDASGGDDYWGDPNPTRVNEMIGLYEQHDASLFAIVGGVPACPQVYNDSRGYNAVVAGLPGSASLSICGDQTANMEQVVRSAHASASTYVLTYTPISATLKVALQKSAGQGPEGVPRSRSHGFDYDGTRNALVFYGDWRPVTDGLDITASYRSFTDCIPDPEICDGLDNDCNDLIDETDADGDNWGLCMGDCDDNDPDIHPGAAERCNEIDDDCDGFTDEGFDSDDDGWTTCGGDCDDNDPTVHLDAEETCNGIDDDCDGDTDEGFNQDGDGFTTCGGDCDDTDPDIHPDAEEICDGIDNNCDGTIDEGFDNDGDGFSSCNGDCDDEDDQIYPGAPELCDGKDNDCDGETDPAWACG